jgi:hypothetical protein
LSIPAVAHFRRTFYLSNASKCDRTLKLRLGDRLFNTIIQLQRLIVHPQNFIFQAQRLVIQVQNSKLQAKRLKLQDQDSEFELSKLQRPDSEL